MDIQSATVAVVGVGGLGGALARGLLLGGLPGSRLVLCDVAAEKISAVPGNSGVRWVADCSQAAQLADAVVLCVKPKDTAAVLDRVSNHVKADTVVMSAAAGVTLHQLRAALGARGHLVRTMANVNVAVRSSITVLCAEPGEPRAALDSAQWVFAHVGKTLVLPAETLMDAATALAASGPAWVALMLEALADGAVKAGLPRALATQLACSMVEGTAHHLEQTGMHPGALKDLVMSPGGSTAAGHAVLEQAGVRGALMAAVEASALRAGQLSR